MCLTCNLFPCEKVSYKFYLVPTDLVISCNGGKWSIKRTPKPV